MQPFKYTPNINSGRLRHQITIQKPTIEKDELGQEKETVWSDHIKVWSDIKTLQGREYIAAAAVKAERTTRFIVRYTPEIDETMRIIYKGKVYTIVEPPINDNELEKTLTIIAESD